MDVIVVARTLERAADACARIAAELPAARTQPLEADLSDLSAVRRLAAHVSVAQPRLNVLINNAAVICRRRQLTVDGFERTFAIT